MKKLFALVLCIACGFASAQTAAPSQQPDPSTPQLHFDRAKAKRLAHINARISALQSLQACVQAATDMTSLHACHPSGK